MGGLKRHDDYEQLKLTMQPASRAAGAHMNASGTQQVITYDEELVPKKPLEKKYTARDIEDMLSDARYFIIKSSNQDNINISRLKEEWATTAPNEVKGVLTPSGY